MWQSVQRGSQCLCLCTCIFDQPTTQLKSIDIIQASMKWSHARGSAFCQYGGFQVGCLWKFEIEEFYSQYDITSYKSCVPSWKAILQFSMGCLRQYSELPTLATLLQVTFLSCAGMLNVNTGSSPLHSLKLKLNACSRITSLCIIMFQPCAFQHGSTYAKTTAVMTSNTTPSNIAIVHWTCKYTLHSVLATVHMP